MALTPGTTLGVYDWPALTIEVFVQDQGDDEEDDLDDDDGGGVGNGEDEDDEEDADYYPPGWSD